MALEFLGILNICVKSFVLYPVITQMVVVRKILLVIQVIEKLSWLLSTYSKLCVTIQPVDGEILFSFSSF